MPRRITRREALKSAALGGLGIGALASLPAEGLAAVTGMRALPEAAPGRPEGVAAGATGVVAFVDPFLGTGGHGHTYPGATVPFGMVQLSPDSGNQGWDWCSGYNASDRVIAGFSHTHLSGTGIGDLCDVLVTPVLLGAGGASADLRSPFTHEREQASPGYYAVNLLRDDIRAELTATRRVGWHRYTFPTRASGGRPAVVVDLGFAINWDAPVETELRLEGPTVVSGTRRSRGWARDQYVYFVMEFSRPVVGHELRDGAGEGASAPPDAREEAARRGRAVRGVFAFEPARDPLIVKVGISAVDVDGARRNLESEAPGWDFDGARRAAAEQWERALSVVRVEAPGPPGPASAAESARTGAPAGGPPNAPPSPRTEGSQGDDRRTTFYTALYHALLAPTLYSDADGRYRGADLQVHRADGFENYTTYSLWDTFRAEHPLLTLVQPRRVDDLCRAMMAFYREGGLLPVWSLMANETNTMIGYHAVPVLADALAKGLTGVDPAEALQAMKKSAFQDARGLQFYRPPRPTTLAGVNKAASSTELTALRAIDAAALGSRRGLRSGYARTLAGATMAYHSPDPGAPSALIVRARDRQAIEWESAPVAAGTAATLVWLTGMDADAAGRRFHLDVGGERWFSFRQPPDAEHGSWQLEAPNGARLAFVATHRDQHDDLFGYTFLTLPGGRLGARGRGGAGGRAGAPAPVRLRVTGDDAGADSWYMVFERVVEEGVRLDNEYALMDEGSGQRQVVRADVTHVGAAADAVLRVEGAEPVRARVAFGTTTVFVPAPKVEAPADVALTVQVDGEPARTIQFRLRPVRPYEYIPADRENESVSRTLEYAYDDACIARVAAALGKTGEAAGFARRAGFYRNLFDRETGFMRGRLADGSWKTPFSPRFSSHRQDEYTEGNAWQYTWFVPHDVAGLIELVGGRERFVQRLEELFDQPSTIEGTNASPDISGLIGQYAHGNEPSHHIAYLYAYAGAPWKTQARVRQITGTLYHAGREGLCGNEDCGQMSAWYVFSALGFYPVDAASGIYVMGSPHFERAMLDVGGGRSFTISAPGAAERPYVRRATLNGAALERCWIRHAEIVAGGELVFEMSAAPELGWASQPEAAPPPTSQASSPASAPPSMPRASGPASAPPSMPRAGGPAPAAPSMPPPEPLEG